MYYMDLMLKEIYVYVIYLREKHLCSMQKRIAIVSIAVIDKYVW